MIDDDDAWLSELELQLSSQLPQRAAVDVLDAGRSAWRAYQAFRDRQCFGQAARSVLALARLATAQLRAPDGDMSARQACFDAAWPLMMRALAESDRIARSAEFAELHRQAARLHALRPGPASVEHLAQTVHYFDLSISAYQGAGDAVGCGEAALEVLQALASSPYPLPPALAVYYLGLVDGAGSALALSPDQLLVLSLVQATTWASDRPNALELAHRLALQAYELALERHDEGAAARAKLAVGQLWLDLSASPQLIQAGMLGAQFCQVDPVEHMAAVFSLALQHAEAAQDRALQARAAHKLSLVLTQSVFSRGDQRQMAALTKAAQRAVDLFEGAAKATAAGNLASVMLQSLLRGWGGNSGALRVAIDQALDLAIETGNQAVQTACLEMQRTYDDAIAPHSLGLALRALLLADGSIDPDFVAPAVLYFSTDAVVEKQLSNGSACSIRTLRLFLDEDGSDGAMAVRDGGTAVEASFSVPCARCQQMMGWTLPLVVDFDAAPDVYGMLEHMIGGGRPCGHCGSPNQVQFAYTAQAAQFTDRPFIVYPAAWMGRKSDNTELQFQLSAVLYAAFRHSTVRAIEKMIPADGIGAIHALPLADVFELKHKAALMEVIFKLFTGDVAAVRSLLADHPAIADVWQAMPPQEIDDVLGSILFLSKAAEPDPERVATSVRLAHAFFALLQNSGADAALADWEAAAVSMAEQQHAFDEALAVAADDCRRRHYLRDFIRTAADFSAERQEAIYDIFMREADTADWTAWLREREARLGAEGAQRLKDTLIASARQAMQETIAAEQANSTTPAAKHLVAAALQESGSFVLLLRAFDLEVQVQTLPGPPIDDAAANQAQAADPRTKWRAMASTPDNLVRTIEQHLAHRADVVAISNAIDWAPVNAIARFHVTNSEWRKLAFSLAAQARMIVFALPAQIEHLSAGASQELEAIVRLQAQQRTIVVLEQSPQAPADRLARSRQWLGERGFASVVADSDLQSLSARLDAGTAAGG